MSRKLLSDPNLRKFPSKQIAAPPAGSRDRSNGEALTRPGRLDRQIVVPIPDLKGRMEPKGELVASEGSPAGHLESSSQSVRFSD